MRMQEVDGSSDSIQRIKSESENQIRDERRDRLSPFPGDHRGINGAVSREAVLPRRSDPCRGDRSGITASTDQSSTQCRRESAKD